MQLKNHIEDSAGKGTSAGRPGPEPALQLGPVSYAPSADNSDSGGLFEYWRLVRRYWIAVLLATLAAGALALLLTMQLMPVYEARTVIEIQNLNENFLNMRDVNPTVSTTEYGAPESERQTNVKLLQSLPLLERVATSLDLVHRFPEQNKDGNFSKWRKALHIAGSRPAFTQEDAVAELADNLSVRVQINTRLIEVSYDSTDPKLAADIVNALAQEFIQQNLAARWQATQDIGEWLGRQLAALRAKLEKAEDDLQTHANATGLQFTSEKGNVAEERLRQLQNDLQQAQTDLAAKRARYEVATRTSVESLPNLDSQTLRDYEVKLTELRTEYADLTSALTPAHPKVQAVQAQIAILESALRTEKATLLARVRNDYDAAQNRRNFLAADADAQQRLIAGQTTQVTRYSILKREVDSARQMYDGMLQRAREAEVASALRANNIRVIEPARPPRIPYKPNKPLNVALGLFAGMFLSAGFVFLRDHLNRTIQQPEDTSKYLELSVLGVIPSGSSDPACKRPLLPSSTVSLTTRQDLGLIMHQCRMSLLAESFRSTVTSILYSGQNGNLPRVLVVSSPNPDEGKTTVASNMAIALAQIKFKVLLIDGDMRRPRIHDIFGVPERPGLSQILLGESPLVFRESEIPNLTLLPSGGYAEPDLLYKQSLPDLVRQLRSKFEIILIDAPPILELTDARVLGRQADAVILVLRAQKTTRDDAILARQRLNDDGTKVLGTILNDWNFETGSNSYHKRYYHYYGKKGSESLSAT